jgi:hypothetical protein
MVALLAGGLLLGAVRAEEETPAAFAPALDRSYPELRLVATDYAFVIAGQVSAGFTLITLVNNGQEVHHAQLMQLAAGQTVETMQTALEQSPEAIFGLGRFVGGPSAVAPGGQTQVILNLEPGLYVALCFIESPDGVRHLAKGMVRDFQVTGPATPTAAAEPQSAGTVVMEDFAFELQPQIMAGPQVWEVVNEGPQPHEIALLKLGPGVTTEQALGMLAQPASPEAAPAESPMVNGPPPFMPVGGTTALAAGMRGWAVLDLAPGEYLAVCFVPDPASGQPHAALGMAAAFTVG